MTTPTPTNEQQDARACPVCPDGHPAFESRAWAVWVSGMRDVDGRHVSLIVERADGRHVAESDAEALRKILRNLAAVSAAAPDEREAPDMACAEEWVREAIENAIPDDLPGWRERYTDKAVLGVMAVLTAALAARPAPVVSGEAVEALRARIEEEIEALGTLAKQAEGLSFDPAQEARGIAYRLAQRGAREILTLALGITVADAPAAECNCGFGGVHDPANPRCRVNDPTEAWLAPAADDEGGQE